MTTRTQKNQPNNHRNLIITAVSIILVLIVGFGIYRFAPIRSYGDAHITTKQLSLLNNEEKQVNKITYGYVYYLDAATDEKLPSIPFNELTDDGFPDSSVNTFNEMKSRVNKHNSGIGSTLARDVNDELNGKTELKYGSAESASSNFESEIDNIATLAIFDLSNKGAYTKTKSTNQKISKEFNKRVMANVTKYE
ncbi:hypothetical protein [Companilactobacillus mishanensis]|uniref:Uncharacterized protein n=1 Tax=Companilactobacillus mishanensis TaxID=2486008 RepID=A0A5P0ZGH4_9LACO|nr:hypothetical protein [Companilactobacillus mishanensis]MQS52134.1 hypothetical protein [Companilactobacillus mishanensis]